MTIRHDHLIPKLIGTGAIAVGFCIGGVAPPAGADPDPYGGLHCSCQAKPPAGATNSAEEIERGLREGHTTVLPGLPTTQIGPRR